MTRRRLSVSSELHILISAIEGLRYLAERLSRDGFDDPENVPIPEAIASNLTLLAERLRLFDRIVRGNVDPRLLLCEGNEAFAPIDDNDEEDVILMEWSPRRASRKHRAEWKRNRIIVQEGNLSGTRKQDRGRLRSIASR